MSYIGKLPQHCSNPSYNGRNLTNRVIEEVHPIDKQKIITYYCPVYVRIRIKNFAQMSFQDLQAKVNLTLTITINFRGMMASLQSKARQLLKVGFNRDDSIQITQDSMTVSKKNQSPGVYTYTIQKMITTAMMADVYWSPFQLIYLILSVSIRNIQMSSQIINQIKQKASNYIQQCNKALKIKGFQQKSEILQKKQLFQKQLKVLQTLRMINIKFNFMDCNQKLAKISYSAQGTFGNYDLAESKLGVQYTFKSAPSYVRNRKKKNKENQQQQKKIDFSIVKPFCYAHFQIPLYKFPGVTLLTIFFPLWLLGILNLGIFFQSVGLADRIGSLSGLLIAFVALIPVIRQQLPQSPSVALVQVLVYTQAYATILCFIQSVNVRAYQNYQFIWYENALFLISAIIQILQIIIIFFILILHKCCWQPGYNQSDSKKLIKMDFRKWQNVKCDQHFRRKLDNKVITIIQVDENEQKLKQHFMKLEDLQEQEKQEVEIKQGSQNFKSN